MYMTVLPNGKVTEVATTKSGNPILNLKSCSRMSGAPCIDPAMFPTKNVQKSSEKGTQNGPKSDQLVPKWDRFGDVFTHLRFISIGEAFSKK